MRNEKGISLLEVMASVVIMTLVVSVGIALFYAVNSMSTRTKEQGSYDSMKNLTTNTILRELSDAVEIYYPSSGILRWKKFDGTYEMLSYDSVAKTLSLYHITGATDVTNGTASLFLQLSSSINSFSVQDTTAIPLPVGTHFFSGQSNQYQIGLVFDKTITNGTVKTATTETVTLPLKQFKP
jgi:Tfp pilus assembly protein PilV